MAETFSDLGVAPALVEALAKNDVVNAFPIQALAIPDALAGRDICGKAKTGAGKTLAFGIPALQLVSEMDRGSVLGIILVPTRELAVQVEKELNELGKSVSVNTLAVYGGTGIEKQIRKLEKNVDLLVATPGRLIDLLDREVVQLDDVKLVIMDEADRMADMGFMPQVEWILRKIKSGHQTLLFSATLDGAVNSLFKRYQTDPATHEVVSEEISVESMKHRFFTVHDMDRDKVLASIIDGVTRTIVFCNTKRSCDRLTEKLGKLGVNSEAIHGDLRQRNREKALNDFSNGQTSALIATDVAARGIHVDEVDVVVHYDPPEDHKTYIHRSGRTARAGENGVVATLILWDQELIVKRLQKRLGLDIPIIEVFSNDERLKKLDADEDFLKVG